MANLYLKRCTIWPDDKGRPENDYKIMLDFGLSYDLVYQEFKIKTKKRTLNITIKRSFDGYIVTKGKTVKRTESFYLRNLQKIVELQGNIDKKFIPVILLVIMSLNNNEIYTSFPFDTFERIENQPKEFSLDWVDIQERKFIVHPQDKSILFETTQRELYVKERNMSFILEEDIYRMVIFGIPNSHPDCELDPFNFITSGWPKPVRYDKETPYLLWNDKFIKIVP